MKIWPAPDLAHAEFEDPTFLVKPQIPLGGTVLLHGKRQVGKTQFSLTLANAICNGYPFLGEWPVEQGKVVIIQVDMTAQIQQKRIQKLEGLLHLEGLHYLFPGTLEINKMKSKHPKTVERIRKLDPHLIVWDTLRRIHRLDENSSEAPQIVFSSARELFPHATHEFVHHDKKSPADPQYEQDPEEAFRGSGDWIDSVDTSLQLKRVGSSRRAKLFFHKARTAPESQKEPVLLEMDKETMLMLPVERSIKSDVDKILAASPELSPDEVVDVLVKRGACSRGLARSELKRRGLWNKAHGGV